MFGLLDGGFVLKRLVDIRADLKSRIEAYVGRPIDDSGNSALGMLVGITSQGLAALWSELARVSDNMDPDTSEGANLYDWGRRRGLTPKPAQPMRTNAIMLSTQSPPQTLPAGTTCVLDGVSFSLDVGVTVASGVPLAMGVWTAVDNGHQSVQASTATIGLVDVEYAGGSGGRDAETEDEFRVRVAERVSDTGCSTDPAMTLALRAMPELYDAVVVSNRLMSVVDQMSPKSYEAIIAPVDTLTADGERAVLDALYSQQPAGIESNDPTVHGATNAIITHTYSDVAQTVVNATIADDVPIDIEVLIDGGPVNVQQITDAITQRFGIYRIGQSVYASSFYCAVAPYVGNTGFTVRVNNANELYVGSRERAVLALVEVR